MPLRSQTGTNQQNQTLKDELRVTALQFGLLSPEVICQMSVAEIKSTLVYDQTTFAPNFHAINDPRMGVMEKQNLCYTCKSGMNECPGHFGHIVLHSPVYHPGLLTYIVKFLRIVCFNCSKLMLKGTETKFSEEREKLMKIKSPKNRFRALLKMAENVGVCDTEHGGCGHKQPKIKKGSLKIEIEFKDENFDKTRDRKGILWPEEVHRVLARISDDDCKIMGLNILVGRPEWAVIKVLPVAPPPVRPSVQMGGTMRSEDDLTFGYQQVLKINNLLKEQVEKGANQTIIEELNTMLQYYVSTLMDNKIAGQPVHKHKSGKPIKCIRSRLKGKEGRLRGNLMGKRVDFSARTVITPDPNLALDQLGVPFSVAQGLTVPEAVTVHNMERMRKLVSNGPDEWPGAKYIIRHDQRQIDLSQLHYRSDVHLEPGYIVERHLNDGDYVLFNRQPSLHKMSIMGHRVKVLPFSTFRMNLSVTTPYNADFDGDEMNMHVPQSFESMAEIKEIMAVPKQILAPQSNKPCMGIVQDSLLGTLLMTQRETFIDKESTMQLLMWMPTSTAKGDIVRLPVPAILKPKPLWTGKQIFSMLIPKVNLARVKDNNFCCPRDSTIFIERGELLCGTLNKGIVGSTGQGLGHIIIKDFGPQACADFLGGVQKVINNWLIFNGFTVGVQDIIVQDQKISGGIKNILKTYKDKVQKIMHLSQIGKLKLQPGKNMFESFEVNVNKRLNDARDKSGNLALDGLQSSNRLRSMVIAGSKGSNINISQIMACVGQQNVEGGRIPFGFHRRTLPHFAKDDFGPESKGFVESSYLTGLNPDELYFHAMGGREGLIDTAVKTAETGYISRRLIKALEDVMVAYDGTVRTSKSEIVQFLYGEDGMAGEYIEDLSIDMLRQTNKELKDACLFPEKGDSDKTDRQIEEAIDSSEIQSLDLPTHAIAIRNEYKRIMDDRQTLRNETFKLTLDDQVHLPVNIARMIWNAKTQFGIKSDQKTTLTPSAVISKLNSLIGSLQVISEAQVKPNQLLINADSDAKLLFSMQLRHKLCSRNVILQERLSPQAFDWLCAEIKSKFEQAIVNPGEMVGSIAAQSLGEPATQMTLNTFHFAGISAKNVTLGVPRFKEIINVTKNIKTPGLKIFLQGEDSRKEKKVSKVGMMIEWTTLSHLVSQSAIYYDPDPERTVVTADSTLVQLYNDVPVIEDQVMQKPNPWLLRLELDKEKMTHKGVRMTEIDKKLTETFREQISVMVSDDNSDKHVIRIRLNGMEDDPDQTVASFMKNEFEPSLLNELALKGLQEINKVTFTKIQENVVCPKTGKISVGEDSWLIETDGSALAKVLAIPKVDATKTITNSNIEVLQVLGVEAARQSLINEMRFVLSAYGIYVNYRHISTLVDVMALRGKLTSITRSGINRLDSGVLRKCTFEETVEIILEGSIFGELDPLGGISENVILGQLGPFGSGCFGITLDPNVIENNARQQFGLQGRLEMMSDYEGGADTPMNADDELQMMTPMISITPMLNHNVTPSGYTPNATPFGNEKNGAFSPRGDQYGGFDSPAYASPSPFYSNQKSSPAYGQVPGMSHGSPIYNGGLQSANYQAVVNASAQYRQQSPAYNAAGYNPYSPNYAQSPVYSNPSLHVANQSINPAAGMHSPAYSPAVVSSNQNFNAVVGKPHGSYYSPSYSPSSLHHNGSGFHNSSKQNSNPGKSPFYQPPVSPSPTIQFGSPANVNSSAGSVQSKLKQEVGSYNPASPGYVPIVIKKEPDHPIKEEP